MKVCLPGRVCGVNKGAEWRAGGKNVAARQKVPMDRKHPHGGNFSKTASHDIEFQVRTYETN